MDSRKHLANASLGKKSGLPLPQELGQPPPPVSATTAWGQPGAQSGGQQVLQTQDWVSGTPELALQVCLLSSCVSPSSLEPRSSRLWKCVRAPILVAVSSRTFDSLDVGLHVCQTAESGRPSHRWSVSIDERRRLAVQGGRERPGTAGPPSHSRDLSRLVARLASEDVDKDVLLPHPPRPSEAANAFQAFLAPSAPFWQTVTLEAQVSRFTEVFLRPLDPHQSWPGTLPVLGDTVFPSGLGLPALSVTAEVRVNLAFCPCLLCLRSVLPDKQFY
ncbi:testis-expressed protein 22 [Panthera tigris]|uniref:testis-expressed protein 22 n=1 Tax=Panthera tigris TaxID=9694 RepID=UPI001C6F8AE3|nr:testis-expressed protein 22 [Panthera tigris]